MWAAIPAKIPRISLGMAFFAYGTSRSRTLMVPVSELGIYLSRCPRQPYRLTESLPARFLVVEVSLAGEVHSDAGFFGSLDDFLISDTAAGLNNCLDTASNQHFQPIREWEERI